MESDISPWVREKVVEVEPMVISDTEITFGVTLQFVNTGKYPAFHIDYKADFLSGAGDLDIVKSMTNNAKLQK